ncbi:MAG: hypothetical protein L6Q38_16235, partial [Nitrospira sp.]|nr:hypothetical protein [Nitrospira sp.]
DFPASKVDRRLDFSVLNPISRFAVAAGRLALDHAGLKVTPNSGDDVGVAMGVCNGPSEMGHMDSVFGSDSYVANIPSFSNITSNSTAGWVSSQLYLRGVNASFSAGPHAGLQSLAYAFDALKEGRARVILAGAADEVYAQTFYNYDGMGFLFAGEEETSYRLRPEAEKNKILGDGAALLAVETADSALQRGARILGEILGYGMSMDAEGFLAPNLGIDGLRHAVQLALDRSGLTPERIGLVVWAPQGNRQDLKALRVAEQLWGPAFAQLPVVTTTFNTGYIESASIVVSIAAALESIAQNQDLWPQLTGLPDLDQRPCRLAADGILALGSSDVGYNFALVLRRGWQA